MKAVCTIIFEGETKTVWYSDSEFLRNKVENLWFNIKN